MDCSVGGRQPAVQHASPVVRLHTATATLASGLLQGTDATCIALHCTALHCTALHCTALHCRSAQGTPDQKQEDGLQPGSAHPSARPHLLRGRTPAAGTRGSLPAGGASSNSTRRLWRQRRQPPPTCCSTAMASDPPTGSTCGMARPCAHMRPWRGSWIQLMPRCLPPTCARPLAADRAVRFFSSDSPVDRSGRHRLPSRPCLQQWTGPSPLTKRRRRSGRRAPARSQTRRYSACCPGCPLWLTPLRKGDVLERAKAI